jgi:hypothetical protein
MLMGVSRPAYELSRMATIWMLLDPLAVNQQFVFHEIASLL